VPQQLHLFNGTLRDNLLVARGDATESEIDAAAAQAQLHQFVAGLPRGYDTLVGENGLQLSGGERQRLALARVILKDAPVVILDEATANLDRVTEAGVARALDAYLRGRTAVIISHRPALLGLAAQTLVVGEGSPPGR
jgi:ATP-binding cassette subfamily C protein CydC